MRSNPQPAQSVALSATENTQQIIITIYDKVLVTGPVSTPVEIFKGIVMERRYLETIQKEVIDPIIPRQVVDTAAQGAK